jgi:DNA-directed RNA polymerase subunit RPC12/RpoP
MATYIISDPSAVAVDGFTWAEIQEMTTNSIVTARCTECSECVSVEPDAREYDCESCGARRTVTSPLVKLGLI